MASSGLHNTSWCVCLLLASLARLPRLSLQPVEYTWAVIRGRSPSSREEKDGLTGFPEVLRRREAISHNTPMLRYRRARARILLVEKVHSTRSSYILLSGIRSPVNQNIWIYHVGHSTRLA